AARPRPGWVGGRRGRSYWRVPNLLASSAAHVLETPFHARHGALPVSRGGEETDAVLPGNAGHPLAAARDVQRGVLPRPLLPEERSRPEHQGHVPQVDLLFDLQDQ